MKSTIVSPTQYNMRCLTLYDDKTWKSKTHLRRSCSTGTETAIRWPSPRRTQWRTSGNPFCSTIVLCPVADAVPSRSPAAEATRRRRPRRPQPSRRPTLPTTPPNYPPALLNNRKTRILINRVRQIC